MRILVATDLSDAAAEAVRQAHAHALWTNGRLAVCHVVPQLAAASVLFPQDHGPQALSTLDLRERLTQMVGDNVVALTGLRPEDFDVFIDEGTVYAEIVRRAEAWGSDLIVVGSRGSTAFTRLLLGNVAEKVVRYAACPVLVARPSHDKGCVVAATDLSDPSLPAVEAAARAARLRGASLKVLHVVEISDVGSMFGMPITVARPAGFAETQAALRKQLEDAMVRYGATGEAILADGPPAATIVRLSEELSAGLVVVGTHGRTGVPRMLIGSVAETVVRSAACSVQVVRLAP